MVTVNNGSALDSSYNKNALERDRMERSTNWWWWNHGVCSESERERQKRKRGKGGTKMEGEGRCERQLPIFLQGGVRVGGKGRGTKCLYCKM